MGMYDTLIIDNKLLPTKVILEWQTKSLDCRLGKAIITEDNKLYYNGRRIKGDIVVNFYGFDTKGDWWEYNATFKDGKLTSINGGKEDEENTNANIIL